MKTNLLNIHIVYTFILLRDFTEERVRDVTKTRACRTHADL